MDRTLFKVLMGILTIGITIFPTNSFRTKQHDLTNVENGHRYSKESRVKHRIEKRQILDGSDDCQRRLQANNITGIPLPFNIDEQTNLVKIHNDYRRQVSPEASNMEYMVWDDQLAAWAQQWTDTCYYEHGFPPAADHIFVGQNLWRGFVVSEPDGVGPVSSWWNEWRWYDYDTNTCQEGKICSHYTQLVWDTSSRVGCSRSFCPVGCDILVNFTNNYIVACNYLEQGNKRNTKPYENGTSCTRCGSGIMECDDKLCRTCKENGTNVECSTTCEVNCQNCGVANPNCTCTCTPQFTGVDCSAPCGNYDTECGAGWPEFTCSFPGFEFVQDICPEMCGLCSSESNDLITGCPVNVQETVYTNHTTDGQQATVRWNEPMPTRPSAVLTSQSHTPGGLFPAGLTSVQYVYSDDGQDVAATCCFNIEVVFTLGCLNNTVRTDFGDILLLTREVGASVESLELCPETSLPIVHADCRTDDGETAYWDIDIRCQVTRQTTEAGTTGQGSTQHITTNRPTIKGTTAENYTSLHTTAEDSKTLRGTTEGTTFGRFTLEVASTVTDRFATEVATTAGPIIVSEGTSILTEGIKTLETTTEGGGTEVVTKESTTGFDSTTDDADTKGNITQLLEEILMANISKENLYRVTEDLFVMTQHEERISSVDIALLYRILHEIGRLRCPYANVTSLMVGIVNNLMDVDEDVLASAQNKGNFTTLIVEVLESQLNIVETDDGAFNTSCENVATKVLDLSQTITVEGLSIALLSLDTNDVSNSKIKVDRTLKDTLIEMNTLAKVFISIEAVRDVLTAEHRHERNTTLLEATTEAEDEFFRLVFTVYVHDAMFPSKTLRMLNQMSTDFNRTVNTPVVSVIIGGQKIDDLIDPVKVSFSRLEPGSGDSLCSFWDFSASEWSMTGCQLVLSYNSSIVSTGQDQYYTCACDHLTNFAVLMDIYAQMKSPKAYLRVLSIIGCTISSVCLLATLLLHLYVGNGRRSQSRTIFLCLCSTLLCLYIAFLVIIALDTDFQHAEIERIPCTVLAALVHYFVLSSMTWMGIEGLNTYLVIVRVFDTHIQRFIAKATLVGWGIPAVIVAATGGIAQDSYAVNDYCYLQKWPLIGGLLIPMAIILLFNIAIFTLATIRLQQSASLRARVKGDSKVDRAETLGRIQNGISMMALLGFTWITGYLTLINVELADILFIVSNSLLGFFVFVLYCLRKDTIRARICHWLRCGFLRDIPIAESQRNSGSTYRQPSGNREIRLTSVKLSSSHSHINSS